MKLKRVSREKAFALAAEMAEEWKRNQSKLFTLRMGASTAFNLLGQLQLALRHRQNTGPLAKEAREIAMQIQVWLGALGPATCECCRMGWDETIQDPFEGEDRK